MLYTIIFFFFLDISDLSEIHARLVDHRPILQGHISFFVKEFEVGAGSEVSGQGFF